MSQPELGKVVVGDELLVIRATYGRRAENPPVEAVVAKVGRVWIELAEKNNARSQAMTWRMRLDTQNEGSQYSNQNRFVTREQYAYGQRVEEVDTYLRAAGVQFTGGSSWGRPEMRLKLANLMRRSEELPEL